MKSLIVSLLLSLSQIEGITRITYCNTNGYYSTDSSIVRIICAYVFIGSYPTYC